MVIDYKMQIRQQLLPLLLVAGALFSNPAYSVSEGILAEYNYYESGKIELNAGNYPQAITHYDNLEKIYPKSPYIPQARLESAYAYYKLGDAQAAIDHLQEFLEKNNRHPHKPYAFYLAGLSRYQEALQLMESSTSREGSNRARTTAQQAIDYLSQLVDQYPESLYSEDARQKTTYLLEKVVLHRIKVEGDNIKQDRQQRIKAESERNIALLMKQPANAYTLQLIRVPDYDTAFKVAVQYKLEKNATIIETETAEGSGYTLLYGIYSSKQKAMQAGSNLPGAILQTQPQVRGMGSLQSEIVESRLIASGIKREPASAAQNRLAPPPRGETSAPINIQENRYTNHERWLLSQSPSDYSIQLMGASNEQSLISFISTNRLNNLAYYYRTPRKDGSTWYSLLYGSYPNRNAALEAARQVSAQFNIREPWLRSFKGIQSEIRNAATQE